MVDKSGYRQVLLNFADQLADAQRLTETTATQNLQSRAPGFRNIVYCGMGGSAIAGDFIRSLFLDVAPIPITVVRDYHLPGYAGPETLVILSSYSGTTEETLSAAQDAVAKGCGIITLSTGGPLRKMTAERSLVHIELPSGYMPRQALAYPLTTLYGVLSRAFGMDGFLPAIEASIQSASKWIPRLEKPDLFSSFLEPSKLDIPIAIYSSDRILPAAVRWKGQLCENAKLHAFANALPEMNHNEIMAWEPVNSASAPLRAVLLRDEADLAQTQKRFQFTASFLRTKTSVLEFQAEGASRLERFIHLIQIGDWFSYHLAIARGLDPTPIESIGKLKAFLAG